MKRLGKIVIISTFFVMIILGVDFFYNNFQKEKLIQDMQVEMKENMGVLVKTFNKYAQEDNYLDKEEIVLTDNFICLDISIGDSLDKVVEKLGEPQRIDLSKYGFQWYIYNKDYSQYLQVGIEKDKVVGLSSNSLIWQSQKGVKIGSRREEVEGVLGKPLKYIKKGDTLYYINNPEENSTYLVDNYYITFFYDLYDDYKVSNIKLIEKNMEENLKGFYGMESDELRESFEREIFDLTNATRVRLGKEPFVWSDKGRLAARKHSKDMADKNFFNHEDPSGRGPAHRIEEEEISWQRVGENIAAGQTSPIFAHENWMNSKGHRENSLGDFTNLGVGVYFGGDFHIYYTQKFYTPSP